MRHHREGRRGGHGEPKPKNEKSTNSSKQRTSVLVHVDGLQRLPPCKNNGVVLVVGLALPEEDGPRQLYLVLLHDALSSLVVSDQDRKMLALLRHLHVGDLSRARVSRLKSKMRFGRN